MDQAKSDRSVRSTVLLQELSEHRLSQDVMFQQQYEILFQSSAKSLLGSARGEMSSFPELGEGSLRFTLWR
jgi:hypothetical protein